MMNDENYMQLAIKMALRAREQDEVPIGAVIVLDGEVIAQGFNQVRTLVDPCAHAEIMALREAAKKIDNYRLLDSILYTTLEPCAMCAGAIVHARVKRLVYGAPDPKAGACGSILQILNEPKLNHNVEITPGILADECGNLLVDFFKQRR